MITNDNRTVITVVNYDHKTFKVQAKGLYLISQFIHGSWKLMETV